MCAPEKQFLVYNFLFPLFFSCLTSFYHHNSSFFRSPLNASVRPSLFRSVRHASIRFIVRIFMALFSNFLPPKGNFFYVVKPKRVGENILYFVVLWWGQWCCSLFKRESSKGKNNIFKAIYTLFNLISSLSTSGLVLGFSALEIFYSFIPILSLDLRRTEILYFVKRREGVVLWKGQ